MSNYIFFKQDDNGEDASGKHFYQDISSVANLNDGDQVELFFTLKQVNLHADVLPVNDSSGNPMTFNDASYPDSRIKVYIYGNDNGTGTAPGALITHGEILTESGTGTDFFDEDFTFNRTLSTGQGTSDASKFNTIRFVIMDIEEAHCFGIDDVELKYLGNVTNNWTFNNLASNPYGTINFLDGGTALQGGTGIHVVDSSEKYRLELQLVTPDGYGPQNAIVRVNGLVINVDDPEVNTTTFIQSGTIEHDVYLPNSGALYIEVTGGAIGINSISLTNLELFGGNLDCWDMNGGVNQNNIYAFSDSSDGRVVFDEAPVGTYLNQATPVTNQTLDFTDGAEIKVSFNLDNYTGSGELKFYLYNGDGEGFEQSVDTSTNGNKYFTGTIGTAVDLVAQDPKVSKFGFEVTGSNTFSGEIDSVDLVIDGRTKGTTVSYNEASKGWVSFKSFVPEYGISVSNQYYTMSLGRLWKHHILGIDRNTFYGVHEDSSVRPILNTHPDLVKNFNTLKYEGSQSKVDQLVTHTEFGPTLTPIGNNLIDYTNFQLFLNDESNAFLTTDNNSLTVIDFNGGLLDAGDASDTLYRLIENLDDTLGVLYRLSFDFRFHSLNPEDHVYFTIGGIQYDSRAYTDQRFNENFQTGQQTIAEFITTHPFIVDQYDQDISIEITNLVVQRLEGLNPNDGQYYNLQEKDGWYVDYIKTDKQEGTLNEFIEKEGKWFNYIKGLQGQVDTSAFNFQGLGIIESVDSGGS
jgi:hypothetical protein